MIRILILALGLVLHGGTAGAVDLQKGLNGSWWNTAQDGQGFVIHVIPEADQIFVAWFTYEEAGGTQMWITGSGSLQKNPISLQLLRPSGGVLNAAEPLPELTPWGTATLEFTSCTSATFSFEGESTGEVKIERLTPLVQCDPGSGP